MRLFLVHTEAYSPIKQYLIMRTREIANRSLTHFVLQPAIFSFLVITYFSAHAQDQPRKSLLGITTGLAWTEGWGLNPQLGISYEYQFTRHSSIEASLRWMPSRSSITGVYPDNNNWIPYSSRQVYNYYSLPVLYKYRTSIVNISAGPVLNMMRGHTKATSEQGSATHKLNFSNINVGAMLKIGKSIYIKDRFVMEPEIGVSQGGHFTNPVVEANLTLKYKL